jgi:cytochrome b
MLTKSSKPATVKAWDPLIRIFHWSLVLFFVIAFASEDDWMNLHIWAGYAVSLLIGFRLLWGLVGTRTARFSSFVRSRGRNTASQRYVRVQGSPLPRA